MIADLKKAKKADLIAEIELFSEAKVEGVAAVADLKTNAALVAEIERLTAANGLPVKLDAAFAEANPSLAKILTAAGATEGEIVFAEPADLEESAKLDAELAERTTIIEKLGAANVAFSSDESTEALRIKLSEVKDVTDVDAGIAAPSEVVEDLVYNHNGSTKTPETVVRVANVIAYGKQYKDVVLVNGTTHRLTPEQYAESVTPRV